MSFIRKIFVVLAFLSLMLCISSCSRKAENASLSTRPVITVGSEDYPPFTDLDNNGDPTGLDMDILREAFDRIGYDIQFVAINWEDKDKLLESGEVDCVTGGFTIESRQDDYLWVGPYMSSNQVVAVNTSSGIHTLEDLEGMTIAVQAATIAGKILLNNSNPNMPKDVEVYLFEDNSLPFAALGCDYVDAIVADEPVIVQYMKDYSTLFTILEEPLMEAVVGTAFAKNGDAELCAALNDAIMEMREDGTLEKIISRYLDDAEKYMGGSKYEK